MASRELIVPATEYTPLPKREPVSLYGWSVPKKRELLPVKKQLPGGDQEKLRQLWEDTDRQLAQYRYPDQEDFKNAERQTGRGMWSNELIRKILALNNRLWVEDCAAIKGCAGFYWAIDGVKKFTNASFEKGFLPEFSIIRVDRADLPAAVKVSYVDDVPNSPIKYGWRTVLLRLVKVKALTMRQVVAVFGDVEANDTRGRHWSANISAFK